MALPFPSGGKRPYNRVPRTTDPYAHIKRNLRIKSPQVRVISPEGRQLGVLDTPKALALAQQFNLDLVEVAAAAVPPVCRIMDFGKYIYEEQKKQNHQRPAAGKIKEIELTVRIEQHDFITKLRHAEEFLDHGNKVKIRLKFRGREMARTAAGFDLMKRALVELETMAHPDSPPKLNGKQINVMLTPLPINKRKPRHYERPAIQKPENGAAEPDSEQMPVPPEHPGPAEPAAQG